MLQLHETNNQVRVWSWWKVSIFLGLLKNNNLYKMVVRNNFHDLSNLSSNCNFSILYSNELYNSFRIRMLVNPTFLIIIKTESYLSIWTLNHFWAASMGLYGAIWANSWMTQLLLCQKLTSSFSQFFAYLYC